jgi:hypothetical protein
MPCPTFHPFPASEAVLEAMTPTDSSNLKFLHLNTHSPPASAANAGGFLQTSLSKVTRRSASPSSPPALLRRVTPDTVIALLRSLGQSRATRVPEQ